MIAERVVDAALAVERGAAAEAVVGLVGERVGAGAEEAQSAVTARASRAARAVRARTIGWFMGARRYHRAEWSSVTPGIPSREMRSPLGCVTWPRKLPNGCT